MASNFQMRLALLECNNAASVQAGLPSLLPTSHHLLPGYCMKWKFTVSFVFSIRPRPIAGVFSQEIFKPALNCSLYVICRIVVNLTGNTEYHHHHHSTS